MASICQMARGVSRDMRPNRRRQSCQNKSRSAGSASVATDEERLDARALGRGEGAAATVAGYIEARTIRDNMDRLHQYCRCIDGLIVSKVKPKSNSRAERSFLLALAITR